MVHKPIFETFPLPVRGDLSSSAFAGAAGVPRRTALRWIGAFEDRGVLREITSGNGRRPRILLFSKLLNIAEGREVF